MKNEMYLRVSIGMHLTKKMVTSTEKKNKGNLFVYNMCYKRVANFFHTTYCSIILVNCF